MKSFTTFSSLCAVLLCFVYGCSDSATDVIITEQLLAEVAGDSIVLSSQGSASTSQSVSSNYLDFTNADSMRIKITYRGTANNDSVNAIQIGYLLNIVPVNVFSIKSASVSQTETMLDTTIASPRVNQSFVYTLNFSTTDPSGGSLFFKDLKIYRK